MAVSEDSDVQQQNSRLKEIEELVFDQDVILSYKKLSKLLNIHVNEAKRLLSLFAEQKKHGKRNISVSYLISGKEASKLNTGAWRVCVVPESKLKEVEEQFDSLTRSVHVYSVHQGNRALNTGVLLEASKCTDGSQGISGIANKNAKPYNYDRMQEMVRKVTPSAPTQSAPAFLNRKPQASKPKIDEAKKTSPEIVKEKEHADDTKQATKTDDEQQSKKTETKQASGTLAGLFAAQSSKPGNNKPAVSTTINKKGGKKGSVAGNIASFFQRQKDTPQQPPAKKIKMEPEVIEVDASENDIQNSSAADDSHPMTNGKEKTAKKPAKKIANKRPASDKNKKKEIDNKKRKRIIAISESESSDEEEKEELMEVDSPPPPTAVKVESEDEGTPVEIEKPTEGIVKERKLVDKVFKDENGFIVTKKEWIIETRKVDAEEVTVAQEVKKSPTSEKMAPVKRKQQSDIMSFFARK